MDFRVFSVFVHCQVCWKVDLIATAMSGALTHHSDSSIRGEQRQRLVPQKAPSGVEVDN
jgi:hypothetical protein